MCVVYRKWYSKIVIVIVIVIVIGILETIPPCFEVECVGVVETPLAQSMDKTHWL